MKTKTIHLNERIKCEQEIVNLYDYTTLVLRCSMLGPEIRLFREHDNEFDEDQDRKLVTVV